jgi:hypothetical protein
VLPAYTVLLMLMLMLTIRKSLGALYPHIFLLVFLLTVNLCKDAGSTPETCSKIPTILPDGASLGSLAQGRASSSLGGGKEVKSAPSSLSPSPSPGRFYARTARPG